MENDILYNFEQPVEQIEYCCFETLESTHSFALNQNWQGRLHERKLVVIFAAEQTKGMGSHSRIWYSLGKDFHVNFVFLLDKTLPFAQIAAFTACQFLNRLTENQYAFQLKWPNDIYVQGRKIGGCISHVRTINKYVWITVGVGINFNLSGELKEIVDQPIISLKNLLNNTEDYPTSELFNYVQDFSELFAQNLHWYRNVGVERFFYEVSPFWLYYQDRIKIYDEDRKQWLYGTFKAIDSNGGLVISIGENTTLTVLNGTQLRREKVSG